MKNTTLRTAAALSAVMFLAACPSGDEESNKNNASAEASAQQTGMNEERLLTLDIPTSRNGSEFTVSLKAYCNKVAQNDTYAASCADAATQYVNEKFMCSRFPLAAGSTRSNSEAVISKGLQGTYKEFPSQYLFTDEEFEAGVVADQDDLNKDNFFVITDISDLDAAGTTYPEGVPNPGPQCD